MSRLHVRALVIAASLALAACSGLKDALTAHVDIAARAGGQELSSTRLAQLMTSGPQIPARKDVAVAIANLWVNYQLLGQAGAHGDTALSEKAIDNAMWAQIAQARSKKFYEAIQKGFGPVDTSQYEKMYNDGAMLSARHILFMASQEGMKPAQRDSVRKVAERIAKQVTSANFSEMAKKYSADGSKDQGGDLGLFQKGQMVPLFEQGLLALTPGEISPVVESQFGYHIIRRSTYAEVKDKFAATYRQTADQANEQKYLAELEKANKIEVKPGAAKLVKSIAEDLDAYREDRSVIATSRGGDISAARLAQWIAAFPPQAQIRQQIGQAPDSQIPLFITNVMRNELVLHAADSAKITLDTTDVKGIRGAFSAAYMGALDGLNLSPAKLADSAKTTAEKERLAASRVEAYLEALIGQKARFVDVAEPVAIALRTKYEARVVTAGIDRAVTAAVALKAKADSAKKAAMRAAVAALLS
jgi:parvulin-like peptidyl-prolyl isomerase